MSRPGNCKDDAGIAPAVPKKKSHGLFPFGGAGDGSPIQNYFSLSLSARQPRGTSGRKNRAHVQISAAALRNMVCNTIYCLRLICINLQDIQVEVQLLLNFGLLFTFICQWCNEGG